MSHKGQIAWNKDKTCKNISESKKVKLSSEIIKLICELYSVMSPAAISLSLSKFNICHISSYPIRRILKENNVYYKIKNVKNSKEQYLELIKSYLASKS